MLFMSRHIRWSLIFSLVLLNALAAAAPYWFAWLEPLRPQENQQESGGLACPPELGVEFCALLSAMYTENPQEAEAMIVALLGEPVPAPSNERAVDSIKAGLDLATVSVFSETRVRTGQFTTISPLHNARGVVNIWELVADNEISRILRFEDGFEVARGPDLRVFLSINPEPRNADELFAGDSAIEIGVLKGNVGGQNYVLSNELDVTQYQSVVIFSPTYERIFSSALLQQPIR